MPSFLEDLIDACVMEGHESMKYEGRMMKWNSLSGAFSSFILHPSSFILHPSSFILHPCGCSLLAVIKQEGRV